MVENPLFTLFKGDLKVLDVTCPVFVSTGHYRTGDKPLTYESLRKT